MIQRLALGLVTTSRSENLSEYGWDKKKRFGYRRSSIAELDGCSILGYTAGKKKRGGGGVSETQFCT